MSYLSMLIRQHAEKQKYDQEALLLKEQVLEVNDLYTMYDGDYLDKLCKFNKAYKEERFKEGLKKLN